MTKEQILNVIRELSYSQGFYGRLLADIKDNEEYLSFLEGMNFKDRIDLILYFEQ